VNVRISTTLCAFVIALPVLVFSPRAEIGLGQMFHPPEGILTVGLRETERHRAQIPLLRIGRIHGMPESVAFWVHVDTDGRALDAKDFRTDSSFRFAYKTDAIIEAVRKVAYRPFLRDGVATEAWVQDEVEVGAVPAPQPLLSGITATFPTPAKPTDFSIRLSRSGCFGTCPSYSVVIHGDGKVEYHGKLYVAIPGDHEAHIAPEAATQLLEQFRAANFFEFKDRYAANVTDNPTYCLELVIGAKKKTIVDYVGTWVGMPESIRKLEDGADEVAGTDRWVSTGPGTVAAMQEAGIATNSEQAGEILFYAVKEGEAEAVRSLLVAGVPVRTHYANGDTRSLLRVASFIRNRESQQDVIKALLENTDVRSDRAGMQEALGSVAGDGNVEAARTLIAAGADPAQLFHDTYESDSKPDQTYLMRASSSGIWEMLDDALLRPHDIHAVDSKGRSALTHVLWAAPPMEDIFPLVDRLLAAGANRKELTKTVADGCNYPQWRDGMVKRGADPSVCRKLPK
jgi:hypothetical protein